MTTPNGRHTILASAILGLALIICAGVVRNTFIKVKGYGRTIQVTGAAFKPITSDFAVWEGNLTASAMQLEPAYAELKADLAKVRQFLSEQGFAEQGVQIGPVQINRMFNREGEPTGFSLYQSVKIEMPDVAKISQLAEQSATLIERGVELTVFPPRYIYTKLEEAKVEMIKAATENAKLRAEQLASTTGQQVGAPTSARVGVFQIRPQYSQEVSDYGINDMSSIQKEIVSTVNISFIIE